MNATLSPAQISQIPTMNYPRKKLGQLLKIALFNYKVSKHPAYLTESKVYLELLSK